MHSKTPSPHNSALYRSFRQMATKGVAINYSAMEKQLIAHSHSTSQEHPSSPNMANAFLKLLSHV